VIYTPQPYECYESLYMPISLGIGLSYKYSDKLMVSFDIYKTNWNDFILQDTNGNELSPITGESIETSKIDASSQFRMGMEYIILESAEYALPLCLGMFYDPVPAKNSPDNFWGITFGTGFIEKQSFTFDIAYQFRFGKNVGDSVLDQLGFSQSVFEHTLYSSLILYF
ncbi:Membrane protein involved in aromatic hydrocarbon degradation, partial [Candidatus Magnetomorum sp. HK-1]